MSIHFPPPDGIASLYIGPVMHQRLKPFGHRFTYRVASLLVDVDELDQLPRLSRLMSHNRFNLFSVHDKDLGAGDGGAPGANVRALLRRAGIDPDGGRTLLLTYPRILGYVFNPLSVYWHYGLEGGLRAVVYEVRNTFGERHAYVAPVRHGQLGPEGLKQTEEKRFHVSPFLGMAMRYHFRLKPPGEAVAIRILETDEDGPILAATFRGEREALTSGALARTFIRLPLMTVKVMAAIHWEALKLWLKGARYHARPRHGSGAADKRTETGGRQIGSVG